MAHNSPYVVIAASPSTLQPIVGKIQLGETTKAVAHMLVVVVMVAVDMVIVVTKIPVDMVAVDIVIVVTKIPVSTPSMRVPTILRKAHPAPIPKMMLSRGLLRKHSPNS